MQYEHVENCLQYLDLAAPGSFYEFGTYQMKTLLKFLDGYKTRRKPHQVFTFDSFAGLPDENPNVWHNHEWPKSAFDIKEHWNVKTWEEAYAIMQEKLKGYEEFDVKIIKCWFNELTSEDVAKYDMKPASFIHCDCDIYQSSKDCMDFMFKNKLVQPGTIFRFDDICSTPPDAGQSLAIQEITKEYNIQWHQFSLNIFGINELG